MSVPITARQAFILRKVVEGHVDQGQPVGSRWLAEQGDVPWGPSTVRAELARLEELGLLAHPHTSAGRLPTDAGYRYYADELLSERALPEAAQPLELDLVRREVDEAMRVTTTQLSQVTNLLAVVTAPPIASTTIRHVEVLLLQPQVVMVVVITSTGGVTKRVFTYDEAVDPGLVDWAGSYLREALAGMGLGRRMLHQRLDDASLSERERSFVATLAPAFTELEDTAEDTIYVDGAARLLSEERFQELSQINELMRVLERRVRLLSILRGALSQPTTWVRIGAENEAPELRSVSVVASGYGLAHRSLGVVGVLGPVRMDYGTAIASVRTAARELSAYVGPLFENE